MPQILTVSRFLLLAILPVLMAPTRAESAERMSSTRQADSIDVQLLFDGRPVLTKKRAEFACFSYAQDKWVDCRIRPAPGVQRYRMRRPYPGRYRIHVGIDDNEGNPDSYPGDYETVYHFDAPQLESGRFVIAVPKVIHLTSPGDNDRSIEGAFAACDRDPDFIVPFLVWPRTTPVEFNWDPVVEDAEYRLSVWTARCRPYGRLREVASVQTLDPWAVFDLPPGDDGEHYQFMIEAVKEGRPVGVLFIHDAGTHGWDYRFRIGLEPPSPKIALVASLGGVSILFLVVLTFMLNNGHRSLAGASFVVMIVSGWLGYQAYASYREDHYMQQRQTREARVAARELQRTLDALFVEEWTSSLPAPDWWDDVSPPDYPIDNVGELMSAWQSDFGTGETRQLRQRQFFKGAYQAVVDHPDDRDLVSTAIDLMAYIGREYPHRREMLELGVRHFFDFDRRIDNCANCKVGDVTNSMVQALAETHLKAGRFDEAIEIVERFRLHRRNEVSDYAWAETITVLARAYWGAGQRETALETLRSEAWIPGDHPWVVEMREQLSEYERELERPMGIAPHPVESSSGS